MTIRKSNIEALAAKHKISILSTEGCGRTLEVEVATEKDMRKFHKHVASWGGYKTGYGSWILQASYQPKGDWCDTSSRHHY
jgi:hypothetical protein